MPQIRRRQAWEMALRTGARSSTAKGWSLREERGQVRLEMRQPDRPRASVLLPFQWSRQDVGAILARVRNIYVLTLDGHDLSAAAQIASGKALRSLSTWEEALEHFREFKLHHGTAINPRTWQRYDQVLQMVIQLMTMPEKKSPIDSASLIDACVKDWPPGIRQREVRVQYIAQFLRFCRDREHFPVQWHPPTDLKAHIGSPTQDRAPGHMKGSPLSDQEILDLIDSLPDNEAGLRWRDALRLMAELGLRPVELRYMSVRKHHTTGELIWWCDYRKRAGVGMTKPRRAFALPLMNQDGELVRWNLLKRWNAGLLQLPPLGSTQRVSRTATTYLYKKPCWISLKQRAAARGERAVIYSFRHSFSLRGHQRGVDPGSMAAAMGHTLAVHLRSYPWASEQTTAAAFARSSESINPVKAFQ